MDSTYSVTQAQTNLPRLIKETADGGSIAITRHEETVAYLISRGRMDAIMETLELLGNPGAMKALRDYEQGKTRFLPLAALITSCQGKTRRASFRYVDCHDCAA